MCPPPNAPNNDKTKVAIQETSQKTQEAGGPDKDHKITICHVPPGNPENAHEITIDRSAWKADGTGPGGHGPGLHGGDTEGPCPKGTPKATNTPGGPTETPGPSNTPGGKTHKITICHVPPGNPANAHEITIDENAWKTDGTGKGGHGPGLHGGDSLGPCPQKTKATATSTGTLAPTITGTIPTATPTSTGQAPSATPTSTGTPTACGSQFAADGSPIIDLAKCGPDKNPPPERPAYVPPEIRPLAQCPDWTLYHSNKSGPVNIYRISGSTTTSANDDNVSRGTGANTRDMSPSRSPDSQYVAFTSNRSGNWEIYLANVDGEDSQRLTFTTTAANLAPAWSPDGNFIVYESTRDGARNLYLFDVNSGDETRLTDSPAQDVNPYWSPDSKQILFQSDRNGLWQIFSLDVASKQVKQLSDGKTNDVNPQFSPDGKKIAYRTFVGNNAVIYTMNTDGSGSKSVSDPKGNASNQAWSPDSTLLAYQSNLDGDLDIFVYQPSSNQTRKVTDNTTRDYAPTWHCGSNTLIFTSDVSGNPDLYEVAAGPITTAAVKPAQYKQLTFDKAQDQYPQNSPAVEDASYRSSVGSPKSQSGG